MALGQYGIVALLESLSIFVTFLVIHFCNALSGCLLCQPTGEIYVCAKYECVPQVLPDKGTWPRRGPAYTTPPNRSSQVGDGDQ
eukprot:scaffold2021_cov176-Amphora_coffeaeformis.AAC.8